MEVIRDGYTRVSEILNIFQAYSHVPKEKLKKAAEIGTEVHEAIEDYYKGGLKYLSKTQMGYFSSFLKFAENFDLAPILQETRFYCDEWRITGRIDLLAELNGKPILIDFKTGSWAHPEIWRLQGMFYRRFISLSNPDKTPDEFSFVQLMKDGSMPNILPFTHSSGDEKILENVMSCYRYFKGYDDQVSILHML